MAESKTLRQFEPECQQDAERCECVGETKDKLLACRVVQNFLDNYDIKVARSAVTDDFNLAGIKALGALQKAAVAEGFFEVDQAKDELLNWRDLIVKLADNGYLIDLAGALRFQTNDQWFLPVKEVRSGQLSSYPALQYFFPDDQGTLNFRIVDSPLMDSEGRFDRDLNIMVVNEHNIRNNLAGYKQAFPGEAENIDLARLSRLTENNEAWHLLFRWKYPNLDQNDQHKTNKKELEISGYRPSFAELNEFMSNGMALGEDVLGVFPIFSTVVQHLFHKQGVGWSYPRLRLVDGYPYNYQYRDFFAVTTLSQISLDMGLDFEGFVRDEIGENGLYKRKLSEAEYSELQFDLVAKIISFLGPDGVQKFREAYLSAAVLVNNILPEEELRLASQEN